MELLPTPDFFDSIDFNFLTAEIYHTQEHEFDYTLRDNEQMQLDWREADENEMVDDVFHPDGAASDEERSKPSNVIDPTEETKADVSELTQK